MVEHEGRRRFGSIKTGSGHALSCHLEQSGYPEADMLEKLCGKTTLAGREVLKEP